MQVVAVFLFLCFFFFKQKTAYELRISDWSSDVCSSDLYDTSAAGDDPRNFYVWGAMGGTCMVGLGLALAQPDRQVLAFVGDGEMLMGIGSFATLAVKQPKNLKIIVIDNEHYGETGMQPAHSGRGVCIAGIAAACGFPAV